MEVLKMTGKAESAQGYGKLWTHRMPSSMEAV